jgi:hypothetical protein
MACGPNVDQTCAAQRSEGLETVLYDLFQAGSWSSPPGKHANVSRRLVRESHLAPEIERLIALTRRSADDLEDETRVELLMTQGLQLGVLASARQAVRMIQ